MMPAVSLSNEKAQMTRIGIIIGSTRPGRYGSAVGKWVYEVGRQRTDAEFELVDLLDYKLPRLDEMYPPSVGQYQQPHTLEWANKIAAMTERTNDMATDFGASTEVAG